VSSFTHYRITVVTRFWNRDSKSEGTEQLRSHPGRGDTHRNTCQNVHTELWWRLLLPPVHAELQVPRPGEVVGRSAAKPVYSTSVCRIYTCISTGNVPTQVQTILHSVGLIPLIIPTLYSFMNDSYHFFPCSYPCTDVTTLCKTPTNALNMLTPLYSHCYTATYFSPREAILREHGQRNTCPNVNIRLKSKE